MIDDRSWGGRDIAEFNLLNFKCAMFLNSMMTYRTVERI